MTISPTWGEQSSRGSVHAPHACKCEYRLPDLAPNDLVSRYPMTYQAKTASYCGVARCLCAGSGVGLGACCGCEVTCRTCFPIPPPDRLDCRLLYNQAGTHSLTCSSTLSSFFSATYNLDQQFCIHCLPFPLSSYIHFLLNQKTPIQSHDVFQSPAPSQQPSFPAS
jgi:hypothetical protein